MAGTRPEIIKLAPVYLALRNSDCFAPLFISTGQHKELLEDALFPFNMKLDGNFQIMNKANSLDQVMSLTFAKFGELLSKEKPAGEKFVATGHDGTSPSKRAVITHKIDKLKKLPFFFILIL